MDEVGVVTRVDNSHATVVVERKGACDSCSMGCKTADGGAEIEAINSARARVGQTVRVHLKPYTYLKGSLLVYGVPAVGLVAGAVAGRELLPSFFPAMDRELLSAAGGFILFILSFGAVKAISARVGRKTAYTPVIEEILNG